MVFIINTKRTAHLRRPDIILFHSVFCIAVAAAIDFLFFVNQSELVNDLLLYGCDAARVFALNDVYQSLGELHVEFFVESVVAYDVYCDV